MMDLHSAQKTYGARARHGKQLRALDHYNDKNAPRSCRCSYCLPPKDTMRTLNRFCELDVAVAPAGKQPANASKALPPRQQLAAHERRERQQAGVSRYNNNYAPRIIGETKWAYVPSLHRYMPAGSETALLAAAQSKSTRRAARPGVKVVAKAKKFSPEGIAQLLHDLQMDGVLEPQHHTTSDAAPDHSAHNDMQLAAATAALLSDATEAHELLRWQLGDARASTAAHALTAAALVPGASPKAPVAAAAPAGGVQPPLAPGAAAAAGADATGEDNDKDEDDSFVLVGADMSTGAVDASVASSGVDSAAAPATAAAAPQATLAQPDESNAPAAAAAAGAIDVGVWDTAGPATNADADADAEVAAAAPVPHGPYVVDLSELVARAALRPLKHRQKQRALRAHARVAAAEAEGYVLVDARG
mmetsp:Transcript_32069/g.69233  ORF Transcript_32069/g.69233 Transcript_32069/m.69233 type:complete len:418 (-) Transcript_32069:422-1675(-)